jgi:uncharacterized 2Fe-2S/4Fe-4S cluster protein (DUF4445 family)
LLIGTISGPVFPDKKSLLVPKEHKVTYEINFQPLGKRITALAGETVLQAAVKAGIDITAACGGEGSCGQCQVVILSGDANPLSSDEEFLIPETDRKKGYRLACCVKASSNLKIHLPKESLLTGQRLQIESNLGEIEPDPVVRAYPVKLTHPSLKDIRSDLSRLKDSLKEKHQLEDLFARSAVIKELSQAVRNSNWTVSAFIRDNEIIAILPDGHIPLGLAVDLGTTKIASYLVNLETGETLASIGAPNPQISYGEDLISRLNFAVKKENGGQLLAEKVQQLINELVGELIEQVGASRCQVAEACIVGNTAMTHLLLNFPVEQLARAPYVSATSDAIDIPASEVGLDIAPGAVVHIPPVIGGYVGADHVAMILACDIDLSEKTVVGIDIGTNTEISLRKAGTNHLTSVSCASGPAFEGAHIRDGMRAASGAVEKVRLSSNGIKLVTIEDTPAVGLCGSGILDAVAELYKAGILNRNSRFDRERADVRMGEHGPEFVIVPAEISGRGRDIVMTQKDVNEVILAKGAIQAGLNILLEASETAPNEVQEVVVAGAFGSFLNIRNAIAIGLFPDLPAAKYRQVGNAAALGAKWILISRSARQRALEIAQKTQYLELITYPKFSLQFAQAMLFPKT